MNIREDNDCFLSSQILSGMLLFKKEVSDNEINYVISKMFNDLNVYVCDDDYNEVYDYIDNYGNGFRILLLYDYNSLIKINGKLIKVYDYLISNTTPEIIEFLQNNIYCDQRIYEKIFVCPNLNFFSKINSFFKEKVQKEKSISSKKKVKIKHGTNLV